MDFPFRRLVIWGLRTQVNTHRFIHLGFYTTARKLGIDVLWLDNDAANTPFVRSGDLVLSVNVAGSHLPIIDGAKYVLHNFQGQLDDILSQLRTDDYITLQVYTKRAIGFQRLGNCTYFDKESRTLMQPWGTPLLKSEFLKPASVRLKHISFWVGTVWDNEQQQGNITEYNQLKIGLRDRGVYLIIARVSEALNKLLIHRSALVPSIGGRWQVENGYLPCRMFKNVSFGQIGSSNIGEFSRIFGDCMVHSESIEELVSMDLTLKGAQRRDLVLAQQEIVAKHTYERKLEYMVGCF